MTYYSLDYRAEVHKVPVMLSVESLWGEDWQDWADKLLQRHYGPGEYQKVPDKHKGDAGIEGFTIVSGHAYQAYGPVEPLSTTDRYDKHRTKMTNDIHKFINNRSVLSQIFGNTMITKWILFVPFYDSKEIVQHATKKTKEVLAAQLPYVHPNFRVCIEDENAFAVERDQLINARQAHIIFDGQDVGLNEITAWIDDNDVLSKRIDDKASRVSTLQTTKDRTSFRVEIVKRYLQGQNVLEDLRRFPTTYEHVRVTKSNRESLLAIESLLSEASSSTILRINQEKFRDALKSQAIGIAETTLDVLAWEAIADWIIRCPLDFKGNK